ncbi:hypothetical protein GGF50DRAFT_121757 [Schizophyllum commune]
MSTSPRPPLATRDAEHDSAMHLRRRCLAAGRHGGNLDIAEMCPASLPRRRELVPRPGRERTAAYTDVDIDLDDAKTKLRSSLTMNRPARHSPHSLLLPHGVAARVLGTKSTFSLSPCRSPTCCRGCATLQHASSSSSGSDRSTGCYFSDASKTHGQREALPCNQLDFVVSIV